MAARTLDGLDVHILKDTRIVFVNQCTVLNGKIDQKYEWIGDVVRQTDEAKPARSAATADVERGRRGHEEAASRPTLMSTEESSWPRGGRSRRSSSVRSTRPSRRGAQGRSIQEKFVRQIDEAKPARSAATADVERGRRNREEATSRPTVVSAEESSRQEAQLRKPIGSWAQGRSLQEKSQA